jgi:hypothetical protein
MKYFFINLFAKAQGAFQRGTVAILCTLLIGFFITVSCEEPKALNTTISGDSTLQTTQDTTIALAGTKWKLAGFVNIQDSTMIEAEPKDCERCYTLVFDTDSTAKGYSILNETMLTLKPKLLYGTTTEIDDSENGNVSLLYNALEILESYTVGNDTLKFFYNNNNNYLLYKPYNNENE